MNTHFKSGSPASIDAISLEVLHNGLRSIADEMYIALMKSAYSTNIKERHDHSTCIMDLHGRAVVQAQLTQAVHLYSMNGNVAAILARYQSEELQPGDIFISNDPYAANGSHLPDVNFAMPVIIDGRAIGFVCNIAHHADIGGMAPGSMSSAMTEIYHEGLRIPLVRLFRAGEVNNDLLDMILLNVRLPRERRGDFFAQVAACRLGHRRMEELAQRYPCDTLEAAFDEIIGRTERRMRAAIADIPSGVYRFEDVMDDDGQGNQDIPIRVAVEIKGDRLRFDFTGSAPQVQGNINCPLNATQSSLAYVIKSLLDPTIANNHGVISCIEVKTEPGTLVDPSFPAAVAYRAHTCQRIVDVVLGALAIALPDRVPAASNGSNTTAVFSGTDPRTGTEYLYLETYGGGGGGRPNKDGKDGVQQHIANTANLPVEAIETEYPLRVEEYCLAVDSGGAGKFRGGLALKRVIRPVGHTCLFTGAGERFRNPPWGLNGGLPGLVGGFSIIHNDGTTRDLPNKPHPLQISMDERLVIRSPGSGGYGSPSERSLPALAVDFVSGKYSTQYIAEQYGVAPQALWEAYDPNAADYSE